MVTWMQGLGASMNYATPPPPFILPAQPYLPAGPSDTPVSMLCLYILLYFCYASIYMFLFAELVVERIERPSSEPELAGDPVTILATPLPPDRE